MCLPTGRFGMHNANRMSAQLPHTVCVLRVMGWPPLSLCRHVVREPPVGPQDVSFKRPLANIEADSKVYTSFLMSSGCAGAPIYASSLIYSESLLVRRFL